MEKGSATPSVLFQPMQLGNLQVKNRFVVSATYEGMATEAGEITDGIVKRYHYQARGEVGLIVSSFLYVHPLGRALKAQAGIHDDRMIPGLRRMVEDVHQQGGKMVFQLGHAGRQTTKEVIGQTPAGPSDEGRDPIYFVKPRKMTESQIREAIRAFGEAAGRAAQAGADGVQIHAGHGYLVNQFLSPFFNKRTDDWGGSDENRFRFLKETVLEIRRTLPKGTPILAKLSTNDFTPREGVTLPLATRYARWLAELGIDGLELTCGSALYSVWNTSRGDVPVQEIMQSLPWWQKPMGRIALTRMRAKYGPQEGYNLEAAKAIKPVVGNVPVFLVGGLRRVAHMQEILEKGFADFICMSRPFLREPYLVRKIRTGNAIAVACTSCNKCFAAIANSVPVQCHFLAQPDAQPEYVGGVEKPRYEGDTVPADTI